MINWSHQDHAVDAAVDAHCAGENPVVSIPTGGGKSRIASAIAKGLTVRSDERILITVPSRELAKQNEPALLQVFGHEEVGVVCAALGRREFNQRIIAGTPQSLAGKVDFDPAVVIVDEAHQMPLHRGSWFAKLFDKLPRGRRTPRIGLSATTFRTADGAIYGGPNSWFSCQPFEVSVGELIERGVLAPVRYVDPGLVMRTAGVARSAGDYNQTALTAANIEQVPEQVRIILDRMEKRRRGMIFAVNVEHARAFVDELFRHGERVCLIVGEMDAAERARGVAEFKAGERRIAVTVSAGLTGFDVPEIDLIASCRPTMSPIIHTQSIGRGTRQAPGKVECVALDFAGNVKTFGPVHRPHFDRSGQPLGGVAPWQTCKACGTLNHFDETACTHCAAEMPVRRAVTARELEFGTIEFGREIGAVARLTREVGTRRLPVESIAVHAYRKKSDPSSVSLMISVGLGGAAIVRSWFKGLKSQRFKDFWRLLLGDMPAPRSIAEAQGRRAELVRPASVDIEQDEPFWRVTGASFDDDEEDAIPLVGRPARGATDEQLPLAS